MKEGTSLGPSVLAFGGGGPKLFGYFLGKYGRWYVGFKVGEVICMLKRQIMNDDICVSISTNECQYAKYF